MSLAGAALLIGSLALVACSRGPAAPLAATSSAPLAAGLPRESAAQAPASATSATNSPELAPAIATAVPDGDSPRETPDEAKASERTFTVLACGDILLARTPGKRAAERGYRYLFEGVRDLVSEADIAFANLETPASYLGMPYPGKPENVTFRADPATLFGAAWAGFDVLSLANNHSTDYGPRALGETLDFIDLLGMSRCGAGADIDEARRPAVVTRDGARFAFLAYAEPIWSVVEARKSFDRTRTARAEERLHGPLPPPPPPSAPDAPRARAAGVAPAVPADMLADIARVRRELSPDYLFVSVHWGDEHQHLPNSFQRSLGRAAIDAGATAVLGHHPHVLQSIERYNDGLIIYSLGNFIFDMAADHTYETAAIRLVLSGGALDRIEIVPIRIERGTFVPSLATSEDSRARILDIERWSGRLGVETAEDGRSAKVFF
ncbi:MAG: CapA family protein [Spirochaetes bacterium]|nr:CapA family protein [Spirochaetota bacterium]MBU1082084.1 CapA family protein [Spirochaetota bacterium]